MVQITISHLMQWYGSYNNASSKCSNSRWINLDQVRELIHGIVNKGRVIGFDLVEISPSYEKGNTTIIHAERLICNLIGAMVRANYFK